MRKLLVLGIITVCACTCVQGSLAEATTNPPMVATNSWTPICEDRDIQIISYYQLGVSFAVVDHGHGVVAVHLFKGTHAKSYSGFPTPDSVLPGNGAFGLKIGDGPDVTPLLQERERNIGTSETYTSPEYYAFDYENGSRLYVTMQKDHIESMVVSHRFRTPEGVTEDSTKQDIFNAYGNPDLIWRIPAVHGGIRDTASTARWKEVVGVLLAWSYFLVLPLAGLGAGLCHRRYLASLVASGPVRALYGLLVGAAWALLGAMTVKYCWQHQGPSGGEMRPMASGILAAVVVGCSVGVSVFVIVRHSGTGRLIGALVSLIAGLLFSVLPLWISLGGVGLAMGVVFGLYCLPYLVVFAATAGKERAA